MAISLSFGLCSCDRLTLPQSLKDFSASGIKNVGFDYSGGNLAEVAPPQTLAKLDRLFASSRPQVSIISPRPQTTLQNVNVVVDLDLKGYPLFKNQDLKLGPHLSLILDNEPYQDVYDLTKPIVLENLKPGTHQLSVLVEKPWSESFKNSGAFAQTTFNILTETEGDLDSPLLIYNQPDGVYQAEPILLDFYVAKMQPNTWRVRATVNDEEFLLEQMQPTYLKGFQTGNNLIQLELLDPDGKVIRGKANQSIRLITYDPSSSSPNALAKLMGGQISFEESALIVDQNYRDNVLEIDPDEEESVKDSEQQATSSPLNLPLEDEASIVPQEAKREGDSLNSQESVIDTDEDLSDSEESKEDQQTPNFLSSPEPKLESESRKVKVDKVEESATVDPVDVGKSEVTKINERKETSKTKLDDSGVNNPVVETKPVETQPELLRENILPQARELKDSVSTNSVSEKIRALKESHPEPLIELSPLPTEIAAPSGIKSLEPKSEAETIFQEKISQPKSQSKSVGSAQSSLDQSGKIAIARKQNFSSKQNFPVVDQSKVVNSFDPEPSQLDIADGNVRLNDASGNSEELNSAKFDFEKVKSQINSKLAIWLPKLSEAWQQFSQQAVGLINKAVTALRANFSAS